VGRLRNEDFCGISGVGDRHRTGRSNGKGSGSALYITLELSGLFVFRFIDMYVQCNYAEKHTVNILAVIISPFLRHMRPWEICYCLRLGFECYQPNITLSFEGSPQTVLYSTLEKFPTDCLLGTKTKLLFPKNITISPPLPKREFCMMIDSLSREFPDWWTNLISSQNYLHLQHTSSYPTHLRMTIYGRNMLCYIETIYKTIITPWIGWYLHFNH
jgi:hypothetical protein